MGPLSATAVLHGEWHDDGTTTDARQDVWATTTDARHDDGTTTDAQHDGEHTTDARHDGEHTTDAVYARHDDETILHADAGSSSCANGNADFS